MIYRDDDEALRLRGEQLGRELRALDERLAPIEELRRERARLAAELAGARAELAQRTARRQPVRLAKLEIARPCQEPWDGMVGDERVRHCARCDKDVFNLTEMTQAEAEALLASHDILPCVRFFRRADGTIKTADCGSARRPWLLGASATGAIAALVAAVSIGGVQPRTPAARDQASHPILATIMWRALHVQRAPAVVPQAPERPGAWNGGVPPRHDDGQWDNGGSLGSDADDDEPDDHPRTRRAHQGR